MLGRFDQGSVIPSNLRLDGPEKVGRRKPALLQGLSNLLTSSYLAARTRGRVRRRAHVRARACVCIHAFRLDKVRRLDRPSNSKGFRRLTCRLTCVQPWAVP